jgi:hypothetical protein
MSEFNVKKKTVLVKKAETRSHLLPYTSINSKWINLNVRPETVQSSQERTGKTQECTA